MDVTRESILFLDLALFAVMLLKLVPVLRTRRAAFAAGLIFTSAAYILAWQLHAAPMPRSLRMALLFLVVAQPIFFWLFCNELFDDEFRIRWWHCVLIAGKFILAGALVYGRKITDIFGEFSPEDFPRLLPNFFYTLGFVFHALSVVLRTKRSDLVERRRRLRAIVLIVAGALIIHALLTAAVLRPMGYGSGSDAAALAVITASLMLSVTWGDTVWRELFELSAAPKPATSDADPGIMERAVAAMETDELFRTEGLTVTVLAAKLSVQEYKLRRAINGGLGYRNFNEYLNFYRMRAAKKFLGEKENADYPLIHLALDLGYPSPAPFNRAFKEATGLAPGDYRKRALNASA